MARSVPLWTLFMGLCIHWTDSAPAQITVDFSNRFQTISGWECVVFSSQDNPAFPNFKDELFDRVIHEAGINRLRLEVRSGAENSTDYYSQYLNGEIEYATWRANRYATVNDNSDSDVIEPDGFHFSELDRTIETIVLPLRARAAAIGEPLYINLNYVAFTSQITQGGAYHHANAEEYAEFMLAAFQHMDQRFGFVPDTVEILLEPDNVSQWNGTTVGNAIVATVARLNAAGYAPEIIAPSCTNMGNAISYFDAIANVPGALSALDEICYHRYSGVSDANLQALASRAQIHAKRTSMLEWWSTGNSIDILFNDLTVGMNSAWQQGVLGGLGSLDANMALYKINVADPSAPVVQVNNKTRLLRQVYRFVRRGAVRIDATTSNATLQPLAFMNTNGGPVVVIRANAASDFTIQGLPAGTYGINYSTDTEFNINRADQKIAAGGTITNNIPAPGVITIYQQRVKVSASILSDGAFQLTIRSLKPGFTGIIERNTDLNDADGWREERLTSPGDFISTWSDSATSTQAFFRFQQN